MNGKLFWEIIETAWGETPELKKRRMEIAVEGKKYPDELRNALKNTIKEKVFPKLTELTKKTTKEDFYEFNRILEIKLYNIDRVDIYEYTEGGDDGFLYIRGFIVGMGWEYYNAIDKRPSLATFNLASEEFSYVTRYHYWQWHNENNEDFGLSRETCSNTEQWSFS